MEQGSFRLRNANHYLDLEPGSRWLLEPDCPVARVDIRKPGAAKPVWRWRRETLDQFLRSREVRPGETNPQEQ